MARLRTSGLTGSDTVTALQLLINDGESSTARVLAITMKARPTNTGSVYVSDDSSPLSTGIEITAGSREDWDFDPVAIGSSGFWVGFGSSGDRLDFSAVMEV